MQNFIALLCGLVFGIGLTIGQMVDPNKVLNFLDVAGSWDPSLALVMAAGLVSYFIGYQLLVKKSKQPLLANNYDIPKATNVDKKLVIGAIIFGIGWGIAGICPGPAIANLSAMNNKILVFIAMMVLGIIMAKKLNHLLAKNAL